MTQPASVSADEFIGARRVLGILGLILGVVGTYGVVSFGAARRTHEIGVRMALGASGGDILKLISRQGLVLVSAGLAAGLLAALGLTRAVSKLLLGVSPSDPVTYLAVVILLAAVGLAACWIPARRATRVDPMVACGTNDYSCVVGKPEVIGAAGPRDPSLSG